MGSSYIINKGASVSGGTKTTGSFTPSAADGDIQHIINGGAFTLGVPTQDCTIALDITNNASAGAITISAWTKVTGTFDTTNGHKFRCRLSAGNAGSLLEIQAMQ